MAKLIILVGLPGSGKSTYAKSLLDPEGHVQYCSSDKIREELYGDESIQGNPNKVFRLLHNKVKDLLDQGHDVVYDATNVTRKNRRCIIEAVKSICTEIEAHIVWAPFQDCISRDKNRRRSVGEDVIRKFMLRWQSPFYDEGFSDIVIKYNCNVGFDVYTYKHCLLDNCKIPHDNPHHRLSIYDHMIVANRYAVSHYHDPHVIEAALYHDIGKPFTKGYKSDSDGKLIPIAHYYQHECVGGYLVYGCYETYEKNSIYVSWLVSNHMEPYFNSKYYKNIDNILRSKIDLLHEADVEAH